MPNLTENSRKEFEKLTDVSRAPLPLFQVAMLMQSKKICQTAHFVNNEYLIRNSWLTKHTRFIHGFFRQLSQLRHYEQILIEIVALKGEWVTLNAISGGRGSFTNDSWHHGAIMWCCLRYPTFSR